MEQRLGNEEPSVHILYFDFIFYLALYVHIMSFLNWLQESLCRIDQMSQCVTHCFK